MTIWTLEPGHTAAGFKVRHMMVTWVRGHLKPISGKFEFDLGDYRKFKVEVEFDASEIWTGDKQRDEHLKSADFLDVENNSKIKFKGDKVEVVSGNDFKLTGDLTIRGVTKEVTLDFSFQGNWETPFWEDNEDKGPKTRAGFVARGKIKRNDFGVKWNGELEKGGVVVGNEVHLIIDAEAIRD